MKNPFWCSPASGPMLASSWHLPLEAMEPHRRCSAKPESLRRSSLGLLRELGNVGKCWGWRAFGGLAGSGWVRRVRGAALEVQGLRSTGFGASCWRLHVDRGGGLGRLGFGVAETLGPLNASRNKKERHVIDSFWNCPKQIANLNTCFESGRADLLNTAKRG